MSEDSPYKPPVDVEPVRRWRLRWWFVAGFAFVFLFRLIFATHTFYRTTDHVVVGIKLWAYYYREFMIRLGFTDAQAAKAFWGSDLPEVIAEHLFISAVAGLLCLGIGRVVRSFRP